jgi:acetate kinase
MRILTINGGSSSIRFGVFEEGKVLSQIYEGKVDRIGLSGTTLTWREFSSGESGSHEIKSNAHQSATTLFMAWLEAQPFFASISAVGHRVVHGLMHTEPVLVTGEFLNELHRIRFDPEHLPRELELIEAFRQNRPSLPNVVCFDTAFHRNMPRVASILAIPRRFEALGVRRYGFHGLSYEFLIKELHELGDPAATKGRVILAHLGNGASMAAILNGRSIDTSMGFTPASGLVMGTRSGDLDPGVLGYLEKIEQMNLDEFQKMVNHQSGLIGVSDLTSDIRDLLEAEATNPNAAEAVALFCYQAKKWIGSFTAALGGLDTLVFAGGIGENAPVIRKRICEGLEYLGIEIEHGTNNKNAALISPKGSGVSVRVIHTNEELTIARSTVSVMKNAARN